MDIGEAIRKLDAMPYSFHVGKGRARKGEPLWAVAMFRNLDSGLAITGQIAFMIEGDDLSFCVIRAAAWVEQQQAKGAV